jgi:Protein of unknown function (DUF2778)
MTCVATIADKLSSGPNISLSGKTALVIAALALASGAAALIAHLDPVAWVSNPALSKTTDATPFDARFLPGPASHSLSMGLSPHRLVESLSPELEIKFQQAKGRLAQKLQAQDWRPAAMDESTKSTVAAVPLPKSRPIEANVELRGGSLAAQPDNRTLLQKLSDLFPARITLASLAPDGGLLGGGPDLTSPGYDNLTAVYDISARAVYMPNGSKLEAHSGFGRLMDDPGHVTERNVGATPPAVYDLRLRERLFHGIQAIRMIPVDGNATLGRSGLLAHSYMLGPNGDSNGCVSIKDYEKFLRAFKNGEIKRLVVVPSLDDAVLASRRSTSQS